jgi:hypothetical protein
MSERIENRFHQVTAEEICRFFLSRSVAAQGKPPTAP